MQPNEYAEVIDKMFANKGNSDLANYTDEELLEELRKRTLARGTGF